MLKKEIISFFLKCLITSIKYVLKFRSAKYTLIKKIINTCQKQINNFLSTKQNLNHTLTNYLKHGAICIFVFILYINMDDLRDTRLHNTEKCVDAWDKDQIIHELNLFKAETGRYFSSF